MSKKFVAIYSIILVVLSGIRDIEPLEAILTLIAFLCFAIFYKLDDIHEALDYEVHRYDWVEEQGEGQNKDAQ